MKFRELSIRWARRVHFDDDDINIQAGLKRPRNPFVLSELRGAHWSRPKKLKSPNEVVSGCYMWIDQSGKKAMHECKLLGSVSYIIANTSKCSLVRIMQYAGCNVYVWTYSMKTHYTGNHEGAKMSQDVKNEVFLKLHERTHVNRLVRTYIQGPSIKTVCHTLMGKRRCKIHMCGRVCIELLVGVWGEHFLFS